MASEPKILELILIDLFPTLLMFSNSSITYLGNSELSNVDSFAISSNLGLRLSTNIFFISIEFLSLIKLKSLSVIIDAFNFLILFFQ